MSTVPACKTCRRAILWVDTERGNRMPIDPEPKADGNVVLRGGFGADIAHVLGEDEEPREGEARFTTHFETCPKADLHRRRKKRAAGNLR